MSQRPRPISKVPIKKTHFGIRQARSIPIPTAIKSTPPSHLTGAPLHLLRIPTPPSTHLYAPSRENVPKSSGIVPICPIYTGFKKITPRKLGSFFQNSFCFWDISPAPLKKQFASCFLRPPSIILYKIPPTPGTPPKSPQWSSAIRNRKYAHIQDSQTRCRASAKYDIPLPY